MSNQNSQGREGFAPIFIIGTGRSGTTLLYELMAQHEHLAWISNYTNRFPGLPMLAMLSNLRGSGRRKGKLAPWPSEGYGMWNHCYSDFGRPADPLNEADVTVDASTRLQRMVASHLHWQRKPRFIGKWTGWSRIGFMHKVFPEAKFIHVLRDGRAVARSLLSVPWWDGWNGPEGWRWGQLPASISMAWEQSDKSPLLLAGLQWKLLVNEISDASQALDDNQFLEVRYEQLVANPETTINEILQFCDLPQSQTIGEYAASVNISNMNEKWRTQLSEEQKTSLSKVIGADLQSLSYQI